MKKVHLLFLLFSLQSLAKPPIKYLKNGVAINKSSISYTIQSNLLDSLHILYLGCNNVMMKYKNEQVMFDPFFSYQALKKVGLGKIKFDEKAISLGLERIKQAGFDLQNVHDIFISHGHYDHVFDLPYLINHQAFKSHINLHCNTSVQNELFKFKDRINFITNQSPKCDSNAYDEKLWQNISEHIRVLPLGSSHAPHVLGVQFMKGESKANKFEQYDTTNFKSNAMHWKGGKEYAFLVDIIENNKPIFRILMQGPSIKPCPDILPDAVLKEKDVDIAVMIIASNQYVKEYPGFQLGRLKPKKVIITHWENFFKDYTNEPTLVPSTNHDAFFQKASKAQSKEWNYKTDADMFIMPYPGTKISFK
jgi:hypothetical protein